MTESPPSLYQLVYISSATAKFSQDQLMALLEHSRRKNSRAGISGILLYHDGNFMQLLEGEEATVQAVYARIIQDPRHRACMTLIQGAVKDRLFPDWTMAFRDFASAEVKAMPGYNTFLNRDRPHDTFPREPAHALSLLQTFRATIR
jgi:hypothetical protein